MKNYYNGKKKLITKSINSQDSNLKENSYSNNNTLENNEMLENLVKITGNEEIYNELKKESNKINNLLSQNRGKLDNINLYENPESDIDIYQWNNLFNRSIPITSYVSSSKLIKRRQNYSEENKNEKEKKQKSNNIKNPIALVDLNEDEIKKFLPPYPKGVPPSNVIRFQKLPFRGSSKQTFYFSSTFNDYYKMGYKDFIKNMPILKAKKKVNKDKLCLQIKKVRKNNMEEEKKIKLYNKRMKNKLNNLYIGKQYLTLSTTVNNIQPLMSSLHSQIHPHESDELTKHTKIFINSNKPLGSDKDANNIDYTVNQRDYQSNELKKIKLNKKREKTETKKLSLSTYDINDPDIAIFKRIELLEKIINEGDKNYYYVNDNEDKSIINCIGETKEENIKDINEHKKWYSRTLSAKKENYNKSMIKNINNNNNNNKIKYPRAMSAHIIRPVENNNDYSINNIYLSTGYKNKKNNKNNDIFDDIRKGNNSSQISTYDGINNSMYENRDIQKYFIFKNKQIQNKMFLRINERLKEKQFEKDKQKLEQFSKFIHLDEALLNEDIFKNRTEIENSNSELIYMDKKKIFKRPLSSYQNKNGTNLKFDINTKKFTKQQRSKLLKYIKNNNFRNASQKSSNQNSKIELSTSLLNTKNEYFMNNNNNDKVTLVYFNDFIEMKPQKISDMKPIIKNDGIIVGSNYFNKGKPQLFNSGYKYKMKQRRSLKRVQSCKSLNPVPKLKYNEIIRNDDNKKYIRKNKEMNNKINNKEKKNISSKL